MKLTATTITDEQIRGLCAEDADEQDIGDYANLAELVDYATGRRLHDDIGRVQALRSARARCAEIFNARSTK